MMRMMTPAQLLPYALGRLPKRFRWTLHNVVAHPLSELLYQAGLHELSDDVHDFTIPECRDAECRLSAHPARDGSSQEKRC